MTCEMIGRNWLVKIDLSCYKLYVRRGVFTSEARFGAVIRVERPAAEAPRRAFEGSRRFSGSHFFYDPETNQIFVCFTLSAPQYTLSLPAKVSNQPTKALARTLSCQSALSRINIFPKISI